MRSDGALCHYPHMSLIYFTETLHEMQTSAFFPKNGYVQFAISSTLLIFKKNFQDVLAVTVLIGHFLLVISVIN